MDRDVELLKGIYTHFNARNIDAVLAALAEDVAWANGMEGGHVHGRAAVRAYWTRQWEVVSPQVEPVGFRRLDGRTVAVAVRQVVHDRAGREITDRTQGLASKTVEHVFRLENGLVTRFDIAPAVEEVR